MKRVTSRKGLQDAPIQSKASTSSAADFVLVYEGALKISMGYVTKAGPFPEQTETRNYWLGKFPLAYVAVWSDHPRKPDYKYFLYMPGENDPRCYKTENELHSYMYESLIKA